MFQAVINSTITPNMTFTKTSQKFGQWSDVRANTVYGLGFSSEAELGKVSMEKYNENLFWGTVRFFIEIGRVSGSFFIFLIFKI